MRLKIRLLAMALSVVLLLPITLLLSPAPVVSAQTSSTLYGTGSADEINIVKLLDMVLNKGGMSMSPATIKAFLEFWWSSVQADLNTCISNADAAITTTQDFVDYVYTALEDTEHYVQLGDIIKRYVRYVLTMDYKSLSDFKQLLTQEGTFRQFLLSYVTDQDGNIADTVNNKLAKYNIGKDLVNMTRQAADAYIEEYEGYYLVPTLTYKDVDLTRYSKKVFYQLVYDSLKTIPDDKLIYYWGLGNVCFNDITGYNFVGTLRGDGQIFVSNGIYDDEWNRCSVLHAVLTETSDSLDFTQDIYYGPLSLSSLGIWTDFSKISQSNTSGAVFTSDGRTIKVWKSLDAFKASSVGKSNIYYSSDYSKYDSSVDNSIEFSGSYYNSSSSSYSYDVIQNTIDNSSEVNESTVNNIVNNYITNNNYGDSSGSGSGSGSGDSSGSNDWWTVGDGITAFVKGIAELLDFLLKLLGDLIGLLATFATSVLDLLKSLSEIGTEFGDFLKVMFGFLPDECITLIVISIGIMCGVGIIKMFFNK